MEEFNTSNRDMTLINILERLANHIEQYEIRLDEIEKNQQSLFMSVENIRFRQELWQDTTSTTLDKLGQNFMRYRSDMFGLANEQSRIDSSIKEIASRQATIFAAQEDVNGNLENLIGRYDLQEKLMREHSSHSASRGEALLKEMSSVSTHVTKLHVDAKKQLMADYQQIERQLEELRQEAKRQMSALDGLEVTLSTLMSRTEPPEPREPHIVILMLRNGFKAVGGWVSGVVERLKRRRER